VGSVFIPHLDQRHDRLLRFGFDELAFFNVLALCTEFRPVRFGLVDPDDPANRQPDEDQTYEVETLLVNSILTSENRSVISEKHYTV
jgi:hypothetical protein